MAVVESSRCKFNEFSKGQLRGQFCLLQSIFFPRALLLVNCSILDQSLNGSESIHHQCGSPALLPQSVSLRSKHRCSSIVYHHYTITDIFSLDTDRHEHCRSCANDQVPNLRLARHCSHLLLCFTRTSTVPLSLHPLCLCIYATMMMMMMM